jgi:hypothetical protein
MKVIRYVMGALRCREVPRAQADVHAGRFHLVLATNLRDPRLAWIAAHCLPLGMTQTGVHRYLCEPSATPVPAPVGGPTPSPPQVSPSAGPASAPSG